MYERKRFTDEQIQIANNTNILDLAQRMGYKLKKITNDSYKIEGYGGLHIEGNGSKWNCFSQNRGGGAIQFIMFMEGKTWVESVKQLIDASSVSNSSNKNDIINNCNDKNYFNIAKDVPISSSKPFALPEKNNTYDHVIAYLVQSRKIDKQIVYDLIKQKKLYENKQKSCVFVGYDKESNPKYANVRSTNTMGKPFKQDVANSDKSNPFSITGKDNNVCVFESPIDLMSYITLLKLYGVTKFDSSLISLGGISDKALESYLKENPNINQITLCLDNDEAGLFSCNQIKNKYESKYKIKRHVPKGKDFNEDLVNFVRKSEHKQIKNLKIFSELQNSEHKNEKSEHSNEKTELEM